MKKLRVLVLMHEDLVPPDSVNGMSEKEIAPFKTEYDVCKGLQKLGHDVRKLGVYSDLGVIRDTIDEFKPHITFNLLEDFHGLSVYDHHVVSFLELLKKPYTGCNPRGLMLARDKALSKTILTYHRIRTPEFMVYPVGRKAARPKWLLYPLLVKSLVQEGSVGISQASVVWDDDELIKRVEHVHTRVGTDAIAERYIDGREFYVGVIGNAKLQTYPIWELSFENLPEDSAAIATYRVKWDQKYQKKVGVRTGAAKNLPEAVQQSIIRLCKRAYRALHLSGYARMDLRLEGADQVYFIEANPNPQLAHREDFADSAEAIGVDYESLLAKILSMGLSYRPAWQSE